MLGLALIARPAAASPAPAVVEIDPRVELDGRTVRRLVQLELSDVDVPRRPEDPDVALFVRVLTAGEGRIRVELWERGENHGSRLVSGARGGPQLGARRVALAAAELARRLRQKRRAAERTRQLEAHKKLLAERAERERTLDGPLALRPAFEKAFVGPGDFWLAGPGVTTQIHVAGATRLDLLAAWTFGAAGDTDSSVEAIELGVGPGYRVKVAPRSLDLDLSAFARVGVLSFGNVRAVDDLRGERQTWWARAGVSPAVEWRLSRTTRLSLGISFGAMLRHVPVTLTDGERLRLGGLFLGTSLGVVFTPHGEAR